MRLTELKSRELLEKYGVYVTEVCDKCGKILGRSTSLDAVKSVSGARSAAAMVSSAGPGSVSAVGYPLAVSGRRCVLL